MRQRIGIQQPADHLLVLGMMLFSLMLEKLNALLAQSNRHFNRIFLEYELLRSGQEIGYDL
ncbi:hypothetical protein THITH_04695 [Thioalkalivibrio paradoxus ARh 1]|uniref:Uncharacterized protein n=1 Tax=Thioalkalivibrio paradoxus ARh 1 TaxID=713585 RepID=W0DSU9_9GAMM|nr:hypothetical protein THITH_04695 [Thioalkalivibrio paradoxus ARh 1]